MFVNSQCVAAVLHDIAGTGIVKAVLFMVERRKQLAGNSEGTNDIRRKLDLGPKVAI